MRRELFRTGALLVLTLFSAAGIAAAQQGPPRPSITPAAEPQQKQQQEGAADSVGQDGQGGAKLARASAKPADNSVFVNGALVVPGAPAILIPCRQSFPRRTPHNDELITLAYTFKLLTDEQRRAIYEGAQGSGGRTCLQCDVGVELSTIELRPVPNDVAAHVTQPKDYRYAVADNRVLLVAPVGRYVVGVFKTDVQHPRRAKDADALALPVWRMAQRRLGTAL